MTRFSTAERIRACWLGKNIGGTLGAPHEGVPGPLDLDFYRPVPDRPLPNDDLDLQIVWLHYLLEGGHRHVTPDLLAQAWDKHVRFPFDEYGIAARNHHYGIRGAQRGAFDNYFGECMGGAIRSELWACVAAGNPARAAAFAWADAAVDHCGEGVYAEMFHAAIQAAAFVESDRSRLIRTGLKYVPADSRLGRALRDTERWWDELHDWQRVRDQVVRTYGTGNFTDVVANLCFELIGWLAGEGDFGRSICIAVNCGLDTDCTGATLGALLGIIDPGCIPQRWAAPIGTTIVLSKEIHGVPVPRDLDHLTEMTLQLAAQLKDCDPPIGEILPSAPQTEPNAFVAISAEQWDADEAATAGSTPPAGRGQPVTLYGHWLRWEPQSFGGARRCLRLPFHLQEATEVKVLAAFSGGARAWVDGQLLINYSAPDLRVDTFAAPTFHRGGPATGIISLSAGTHELVIACARPSAPADLVIGIGDATSNLWLPHALSNTGKADHAPQTK